MDGVAFADKTANPDRCLYTLFSSLASIGFAASPAGLCPFDQLACLISGLV
jgi:hypothetical protein